MMLGNNASAFVTYDGNNGVAATVFNNCTGCHSSSLTGTDRNSAPAGVDYNTYANALANDNETRAVARVTAGSMPPGGALSQALQDRIEDWEDDGFRQNAPPTTTTGSITDQAKTSVTLNGSAIPNGLTTSGYFQWGPDGSVASNSTSASSSNLGNNGSDTNVAFSIGINGLTCGTNYEFRAVADNSGSAPVNGAVVDFFTADCDPPVIAQGATTTVNMSEDGAPDAFSLTLSATDVDFGTLTWSISSQASNGAADYGGNPTDTTTSGLNQVIDYTPDPNYTGTDTFVVRVTDDRNLFDEITVDVNIASVADSPIITEGATIAVNMDEDGAPQDFVLTLNATDGDGDTLTWNIDTQADDGTATISGTGLSRAIDYTSDLNFNGGDSFVVGVYDGAVGISNFDQITVTVNISPINDQPDAVNDPTEEAPVNVSDTELFPLLNDTDVEMDPLTITVVGTPSAGGSVSINGVGPGNSVLYTPPNNFVGPPPTGFITETFTYTISDGALTDTATVTVSPLDTDDDTIVDFLDNCDNDPNTTQDNNDGDSEGDECDADDDNDGMPDTFENTYGLDPFDASDASEDTDGDGRDNLCEYLTTVECGGFEGNPIVDDVPPVVAAPSDRAVDATGYLTAVDIGSATSLDVREGSITAIPRLNVDEADACATGEQIDTVHAFRPGRFQVYWTAQDNGLLLDGTPGTANCMFATQTLDVRPLVSLEVDKFVEEGQLAQIGVTLNGAAPQYPVAVSYGIGGTADGSDHDAIGGVINIASGTAATLDVQTVGNDTAGEGNETVVVSLLGAPQAALARRTHTLTIVEGNVAPGVTLTVDQGGDRGPLVVQTDGAVTVTATVSDANPGDAGMHSLDWSATDNSLIDTDGMPADRFFSFDPPVDIVPRLYRVAVTVTDPGGAAASASLLITVQNVAPVLAATDSDGDGDDDDAEGYQDSDGDGIADHLDDDNLPANLLQTETQDPGRTLFIEGEQDVFLSLGPTARYALRDGGMVTAADVRSFGGEAGAATVNGEDDGFDNVGGLFDFEIAGLVPGAITRIVLPLRSAIRGNAGYRKFTLASGWQPFVADDSNAVFSAPRRAGICPGPGDDAYRSGLRSFDECVQLQIEDGGPNDADAMADGTVRDPGGVGVVAIEVAEVSTSSGSALRAVTLAVLCLAMLVAFGLRRSWLKSNA